MNIVKPYDDAKDDGSMHLPIPWSEVPDDARSSRRWVSPKALRLS
jgi:hypothetical protein